MKTDPETYEVVRERVPVSRFLSHSFGNCASFNIRKILVELIKSIIFYFSPHSDNMRYLEIRSPFKVDVHIHDQNQKKLHVELIKTIRFEGKATRLERRSYAY